MFLFTLIVLLLNPGIAIDTAECDRPVKRIEVEFNNTLTFDDLVEMRDELKNQEIDLEYTKLEFDNDGKLRSISFKVDCNDGFSGSASCMLLAEETECGFYRDYTEGVPSPFGTSSG